MCNIATSWKEGPLKSRPRQETTTSAVLEKPIVQLQDASHVRDGVKACVAELLPYTEAIARYQGIRSSWRIWNSQRHRSRQPTDIVTYSPYITKYRTRVGLPRYSRNSPQGNGAICRSSRISRVAHGHVSYNMSVYYLIPLNKRLLC